MKALARSARARRSASASSASPSLPYRLLSFPQLRAPYLRLLGARIGAAHRSCTTCASSTSIGVACAVS